MSNLISMFSAQSFVIKIRQLCVLLMSVLALNAYAVTPLDINTATVDQLSAVLSGVGEAKAKAIVDFRDQNGLFETVEDLVKVKGIGTALLDKNRAFIRVNNSQQTLMDEGKQSTES